MRDSDFPFPIQVLPANFSMISMPPIWVAPEPDSTETKPPTQGRWQGSQIEMSKERWNGALSASGSLRQVKLGRGQTGRHWPTFR
jgi:hypothetical protein